MDVFASRMTRTEPESWASNLSESKVAIVRMTRPACSRSPRRAHSADAARSIGLNGSRTTMSPCVSAATSSTSNTVPTAMVSAPTRMASRAKMPAPSPYPFPLMTGTGILPDA